eukprot:EG_transcript_25167
MAATASQQGGAGRGKVWFDDHIPVCGCGTVLDEAVKFCCKCGATHDSSKWPRRAPKPQPGVLPDRPRTEPLFTFGKGGNKPVVTASPFSPVPSPFNLAPSLVVPVQSPFSPAQSPFAAAPASQPPALAAPALGAAAAPQGPARPPAQSPSQPPAPVRPPARRGPPMCVKCAALLPDAAKFCPTCGAPQGAPRP